VCSYCILKYYSTYFCATLLSPFLKWSFHSQTQILNEARTLNVERRLCIGLCHVARLQLRVAIATRMRLPGSRIRKRESEIRFTFSFANSWSWRAHSSAYQPYSGSLATRAYWDRHTVRKCFRQTFFKLQISYPGQLSLLPSAEWEMSTSQSAMTPEGWK